MDGQTPNADEVLEVLAICEIAGGMLAGFICDAHPELNLHTIAAVASAELFYAAQDTAMACAAGAEMQRA